MFTDEDTADGRDERLDRVVAEYLRAHLSGAPADREAFLRLHPDLAPDLERFFADEDELERLAAPLRKLAPPGPPAAAPAGPGPRGPGGRPLPAPWGEYELLEEVGRGGMGVVYRARHRRLDRVVAVKVLAPGATAAGRFETEARAAARLQHPHVVQIFDVGEHEGQPYLVLEYVAGGSLAGRLKGSPLPAAEAARLVEALAGAVEEAHRRGVVHRDLKPANILLTSPLPAAGSPGGHAAETPPGSGTGVSGARAGLPPAKVADFGLAKQLDGGAAHTDTGAVLGTPSYMAPEQAEGRRGVGPAADIYALGAVLYELLTGRPPFRGATRLDTLRQVVRDDPVPPGRLQPGVPRDLETICLKCLEKHPGRRYASAAALAEDVGRFLAGRPVRARRVGTAGRAWRWCRRQPVLAGLAAALAVAIVAGVPLLAWLWARAEEHARVAEQLRGEAVGQAAEAEQSFRLAHEVLSDVTNRVVESSELNAPGVDELRKNWLEKARAYYLRFLERHAHDHALQLDLADTYTRLARVTNVVASPEEAERIFSQAETLLEEMHRTAPQDRGPRERLAGLGIDYGGLLVRLHRPEEAIGTLNRSRRLFEELLNEQPGDPGMRARLAAAIVNLGIALHEFTTPDATLLMFEQARVI